MTMALAGRLTALALVALYCGLLLEDRLKYLGLAWLAGAGLWLLLSNAQARGWLRREWPLLLAFAGMLLATLAAWLANGQPEEGVKMFGKHARLLLLVPVYLCCRRYLPETAFWRALLGAGLLLGAWSIAEGAGWVEICVRQPCFPRELNGAGSRIPYGSVNFVLALLLLAAWPRFGAGPRRLHALYCVALVLLFYGALGSGTRTLYLALPPSLLLWLLLAWRERSLSARRLATLGGILVLAVGLAWPVISARSANARQEITAFQTEDYKRSPSIGGRLIWWRAAVQIFREQPLLGVGPRQYHAAVQALKARGLYPADSLPHHPHNEYLSAAATRGVVGLAAVLALLGLPLWRYGRAFLQEPSAPAAAGILFTTGIAQMALTESLFDLSTFTYLYAITSAALCALVLPGGHLRDNGA